MSDGTDWAVERVVRVIDGDTVRLVRKRSTHLDGLTLDVYDSHDDGVSVRLVWVDTPERGQAGYHEARTDLSVWIAARLSNGPIRVITYPGGGFDRLLGDLLDSEGESCSQWLMTKGNDGAGWPAYVRGNA